MEHQINDPEVRVLIEVTILSKDGFYSVSKFTPELWDHDKEVALRFAHKEHKLARSVTPRPD
jgi:hypothetical protein